MPSHHTSSPRSATRSNAALSSTVPRTTLLYGGLSAPPKVTWVAVTSIARSLYHEPSIVGNAGAGRRVLGNGAGAKARHTTASSSRARRMTGSEGESIVPRQQADRQDGRCNGPL